MEYILHIAILVVLYTTLAVSLDLLAGHMGLLSITQSGFYGLGAYTSALLAINFRISFILGVLIGIIIASLFSLIVSLPSLRLYGDYFVIATFGFQVIIFGLFNNWIELTRGPLGIPGIPHPSLLGWRIDSKWDFLFLAICFAIFAHFVVLRITDGPLGRVLHAIREDEVFAQSLGKNTLWFKVITFAISAAIAASAGSIYAHYATYIDPAAFTVMDSILIISIVIIGGAGSRWGPIVGAIVLIVLPEVLRFIGISGSIAANMRQMLYGLLLVIMMILRPRGLTGKYSFGNNQ